MKNSYFIFVFFEKTEKLTFFNNQQQEDLNKPSLKKIWYIWLGKIDLSKNSQPNPKKFLKKMRKIRRIDK